MPSSSPNFAILIGIGSYFRKKAAGQYEDYLPRRPARCPGGRSGSPSMTFWFDMTGTTDIITSFLFLLGRARHLHRVPLAGGPRLDFPDALGRQVAPPLRGHHRAEWMIFRFGR